MSKANIQAFEQLKAELRLWNLESVAAEAGVCADTLYRWIRDEVESPLLRTFIPVVEAVGYEVVLQAKGQRLRLVG